MVKKKRKLSIDKRNNKAGYLFFTSTELLFFIGLLGYSFYFLITNSFRDVTITFFADLNLRDC